MYQRMRVNYTSIWINQKLGGRKGWSICAELADKAIDGHKPSQMACDFIDCVFFWDANHCVRAWIWHSYRTK